MPLTRPCTRIGDPPALGHRGCLRRIGWLLGIAALFAGCAQVQQLLPPGTGPAGQDRFHEDELSRSPLASISEERRGAGEEPPVSLGQPVVAEGSTSGEDVILYRGRGSVIDEQAARAPQETPAGGGDFTMNFSDADIREVVKAILGDTLQENFVIDPQVQGTITVQTSRPLKRNEVLPTLEMLLRSNNAALVRADGMYRVVPVDKAVRGTLVPRLPQPDKRPQGYGVRIVPLRYIAASEMQKVLEPFLPEHGVVRVDQARNLLLLAGTAEELGRLQETIDIFDVNWLQGMSVGMFKLKNVEIKDIIKELDTILGEKSQGPMAGMFRVVPLERLNTVMVFSPQPAYLKEARNWIERLDRTVGERTDERRLYVYQVQNGEAAHLADLLGQLFSTKGKTASERRPAELAPGLQGGEIATRDDTKEGKSTPDAAQGPRKTAEAKGQRAAGATTFSGELQQELRVVADETNNTLVIHATSRDYEQVLTLLQQLDIMPREVLVEATIAEITLTGQLKYGVQWFFEHSIGGSHSGSGALGNPISAAIDAVLGNGFTYAITNSADQIRFLLDALAQESKVRILSSPHLMVLDAQTASINVGDQVPISTGTTTNDNTTVERFELKDTGVLLEVTPRINAGGMVVMEVNQEVTDPGEIDNATGQRTFLQRVVDSTVAVQSGQTVVLGGLIRENKTVTDSGIPVLHQIPVVGNLFGSTDDLTRRTELIVLITPLIVRDPAEARQVTEDLRNKLKGLWAPEKKEEGEADPADKQPEKDEAQSATPRG